jgi:hypothetical protein
LFQSKKNPLAIDSHSIRARFALFLFVCLFVFFFLFVTVVVVGRFRLWRQKQKQQQKESHPHQLILSYVYRNCSQTTHLTRVCLCNRIGPILMFAIQNARLCVCVCCFVLNPIVCISKFLSNHPSPARLFTQSNRAVTTYAHVRNSKSHACVCVCVLFCFESHRMHIVGPSPARLFMQSISGLSSCSQFKIAIQFKIAARMCVCVSAALFCFVLFCFFRVDAASVN